MLRCMPETDFTLETNRKKRKEKLLNIASSPRISLFVPGVKTRILHSLSSGDEGGGSTNNRKILLKGPLFRCGSISSTYHRQAVSPSVGLTLSKMFRKKNEKLVPKRTHLPSSCKLLAIHTSQPLPIIHHSTI